MKSLPNTITNLVVWAEQHTDLTECCYCGNRVFSKMYRKWNNPIQFGNRVIWERTEVKICAKCFKGTKKINWGIKKRKKYEKSHKIYLKRRAGKTV